MKNSPLMIVVNSLLLSLLVSLSACQADDNNASSANSSAGANAEPAHDHSQHAHADLEVTSFGKDIAIPDVSFTITPDPMDGWNIQISTENFRFTPENVNADTSPGEGHAHCYVDGFKIARVYGNWYHLKKLTPGVHEVRISLNANDHSSWSHKGQAIEATQTVTQQ